MSAIRVVIADDHEVVRTGIASLLDKTGIEIVAEAADGEQALAAVAKHKPDVAVIDVRIPNGDGLQCLSRMKLDSPKTAVLMLSTYDNPTYIARSIALGAAGYILKGSSGKVLVDSIRAAAKGEDVWSREEMRRVTGALATPRLAADIDVALTQRESEVLVQLAYGLTNKEIAQMLGISYETVKEHVQHLLRKIGVCDRTQAAVWAVRNKLV